MYSSRDIAELASSWQLHHPHHHPPQLLGRPSDDIDIALDDTMGRVFAEKVNDHLVRLGIPIHKIGVVQVLESSICQFLSPPHRIRPPGIPKALVCELIGGSNIRTNSFYPHNVCVCDRPQANPEQSKHLETAKVNIMDKWVDFVNLRSEKYSETSRIPIVDIGTPEDDAFRRDFTINALFYNINKVRHLPKKQSSR
jgi:hypothetical protein